MLTFTIGTQYAYMYIVAIDHVTYEPAGIPAMWNIYDIQAILFLYGRML